MQNEDRKIFFRNAHTSFKFTAITNALISICPIMESLKEFIKEPPSHENYKLNLTHVLPIMSYLHQINIFVEIIEKKAIKNGIFFDIKTDSTFGERIKNIYVTLKEIIKNMKPYFDQLDNKTIFIDSDDFIKLFNDEEMKNKIRLFKDKIQSMKSNIHSFCDKNTNNDDTYSDIIASVLKEIKEIRNINNEIDNVIKKNKDFDIEVIKKYYDFVKYLSFITERIISINIFNTNYNLYLDTHVKIEIIDKYAKDIKNDILDYLKKLDETQINEDPWPIITIINALYLAEPENQYDDIRLLIYDCTLKLNPFGFSLSNDEDKIWLQMKECLQKEFEEKEIYQIISSLKKADIHNKPCKPNLSFAGFGVMQTIV